jgi:hypothetical protein
MNLRKLLLTFLLAHSSQTFSMFFVEFPGTVDDFKYEFLDKKGVTFHGALCRTARFYNTGKATTGDTWEMISLTQEHFSTDFNSLYTATKTAASIKKLSPIKRYSLLRVVLSQAHSQGELLNIQIQHPFNEPLLNS